MKTKVTKSFLDIKGKPVPTKVYRERRNNVRASVGKKALILRIPDWMDGQLRAEQMEWFRHWIMKTFEKEPKLLDRFYGRQYIDGEMLKVGAFDYKLRVRPAHRENHYAKLIGTTILLEINDLDEPANIQKAIRHLLSRIVGRHQKPIITQRVHELNGFHFQQSIKSVNLKYNLTNWGSCSAKGNVNISTRLLFAPAVVQDYVIIHELAHLIELNHSERFWKLVSDAMPDYKLCEKWLKENGEQCHF